MPYTEYKGKHNIFPAFKNLNVYTTPHMHVKQSR